jgi:cell division GTPase FtsZ
MNVKIIGIGGAGLNMINAAIDSGFEPENAIL